MKKKSIFVVALAALMLIAFTACEQQPNVWNPNGKTPTMATITQTGSFVYGQQFDASKFSVEVTYEDGSVSTISGSGIVTLDSTSSWVKDGDKVNVALGKNGSVTGTASVYVSKIDSVTVEGPTEIQLAEDETTTEVTADDYTVSIAYRDQSGAAQTLVLNPAEYTLAISGNSATFGDLSAGTYTVTASVTMATGTVVGDAKDSETLVVKAYTPATEWDGKAIMVEVAPETATNQYIANGLFDPSVITVYQSVAGEKGDKITDNLTIALASPLSGTTNRFASTAGAQTVNITYTSVDPVTKVITETKTTASITTRADYVTEIAAEYTNRPSADQPLTALAAGAPIEKSYFSVTATKWKSGKEAMEGYKPETVASANFSLDPTSVPAEYGNSSITVNVSYVESGTTKHADAAAAKPVTVPTTPYVGA